MNKKKEEQIITYRLNQRNLRKWLKKLEKIETMLGKSKIYPTIKEISARKNTTDT